MENCYWRMCAKCEARGFRRKGKGKDMASENRPTTELRERLHRYKVRTRIIHPESHEWITHNVESLEPRYVQHHPENPPTFLEFRRADGFLVLCLHAADVMSIEEQEEGKP
jgi:hypothetical protein